MDQIKYKACDNSQLTIKGKAEGGSQYGEISGYASTWGNWDGERPIPERPVRGAFLKGLDNFMANGFIARNHNWTAPPIGMPKDAYEDATGLWFIADLHDTPEAQAERAISQHRLASGKSVRTSIGFGPWKYKSVPMDDANLKAQGITKGNELTEIPLIEISLANVPVNPLAMVSSAKSALLDGLTMDDHQDEALAALSGFIERVKSLQELRGKAGRKISTERRKRLEALMESLASARTDLDELLKETDPDADAQEVLKSIAKFAVMRARHQGVYIHGQTTGT